MNPFSSVIISRTIVKRLNMEISFASTLLVTHSKFADVYSLFEESVEEMDPSLVENFMRDVAGIKSKLDTWITLLHYEKEKKTFLDQQNIHRGFGLTHLK